MVSRYVWLALWASRLDATITPFITSIKHTVPLEPIGPPIRRSAMRR
jgi:hypothetical protein